MTLTVHTISGTPRGWRALMGLTLKGLDYETHYLESSKREQKSPDFLKINPRGVVPVLDAGGVLVRDSIAILAWLDREYPSKPLFGETPDEAARIWEVSMECCDYLRGAGQHLLYPILVENIDLPAPDSEGMRSLKVASESMHAECHHLEKLLEGQAYLCGNRPSAAEAIAFPEVRLIQRALDRKNDIMAALGFSDFAKRYPCLFDWMQRVGALKGVENTLPYHW
ncbi:glutathione S-transferase family protein [Acaryochloris marina NIES-2412]|uniref:glutathione S-transferase family protein n=1 Tax=Acaryochloris marina TaxID=155978 RepID=UPI0040589CBD